MHEGLIGSIVPEDGPAKLSWTEMTISCVHTGDRVGGQAAGNIMRHLTASLHSVKPLSPPVKSYSTPSAAG